MQDRASSAKAKLGQSHELVPKMKKEKVTKPNLSLSQRFVTKNVGFITRNSMRQIS